MLLEQLDAYNREDDGTGRPSGGQSSLSHREPSGGDLGSVPDGLRGL